MHIRTYRGVKREEKENKEMVDYAVRYTIY